MYTFLERLWYGNKPNKFLTWLLWPLSCIYQVVTKIRRCILKCFFAEQFPVPIIVVGNLTLGGVGKTPLVIALAKALTAKGLRVGIVSRGYGATVKQFPHEVLIQDSAELVGDEPLLLAKKTSCPVVIAPARNQAVHYLLAQHQSQIIISDDGLQHYRMGRALEIVVIDGMRGLGNGLCFPAGPLRENEKRLRQCDFIVINNNAVVHEEKWPSSYKMGLEAGELTHLITGEILNLQSLVEPVAAVAGIGHPQRFFCTLESLGIPFHAYSFPDHHRFQEKELQLREKIVLMTEKDAVKCQALAVAENHWYFLPIQAKLTDSFWQALWSHKQLQDLIAL